MNCFFNIAKHLFIKETLNDSHIILTFGSVPEGLTNNLPLFFIKFICFFNSFFTFDGVNNFFIFYFNIYQFLRN